MLQRQVDELDELKLTHYQSIVEHEESVWDVVQGKVSGIILRFGLGSQCEDLPPIAVYDGCI